MLFQNTGRVTSKKTPTQALLSNVNKMIGAKFSTLLTARGGKKLLYMYKLSHAVHVCSHAMFFNLIHREFIVMV